MVAVEIEKTNETELLLSGYFTKGSVLKKLYGGKEYEIERYQGEHANEYCLFEVKDGIRDGSAELFDDGIVKMRWRMKNGVRDGSYILFEKGVAVKEGNWESLGATEERVVENRRSGLIMVIRMNGVVTYEGGYNGLMQRDGMGYEFESGSLKRFGKWEKDELVEMKQRFVDEKEMIEYGNGSVLDLITHTPVYIGGYQLDETTGRMKRHGKGYVLNGQTGVCEYESEWVRGEEKKGKQLRLYDGWYHQKTSGESTRQVVTGNQPVNPNMATDITPPDPVVDIATPNPATAVAPPNPATPNTPNPATPNTPPNPTNATPVLSGQPINSCPVNLQELTISNNSYNDGTITKLKLNRFVHLKQVVIGDNCFQGVPLFTISELNELRSIVIGRRCFTAMVMRRPEDSFRKGTCFQIENCRKLRSLKIGDESFYDYKDLMLMNLPSFQCIEIGIMCFRWAPSFSLTGWFSRSESHPRSPSTPDYLPPPRCL